jgi:hypothetical protein
MNISLDKDMSMMMDESLGLQEKVRPPGLK